MSRLIRQICACLAVALLVTMQGHDVVSAQHQVEHGLRVPGVSFTPSALTDDAHHDDHDAEIVVAGVNLPDGAQAQPDADGDDQPVRHHHHNGVDLHVFLIGADASIEAGFPSSADLGPTPDSFPPGAGRDAPSDPPRQLSA